MFKLLHLEMWMKANDVRSKANDCSVPRLLTVQLLLTMLRCKRRHSHIQRRSIAQTSPRAVFYQSSGPTTLLLPRHQLHLQS